MRAARAILVTRCGRAWIPFALEVADRAGLDSRTAHLGHLGIGRSPVRALGHSSFLSLQDPAGIQIELRLTTTPNVPAARCR
jgi:hypothetical protein